MAVHEQHDVVHEWHEVDQEQFMKFQLMNTEFINQGGEARDLKLEILGIPPTTRI